jgi:hypothetical protein
VRGRAALPKRPGQLLAELPVLGSQPADLGVDGFQALPQRGVRGALAGRDRRRARRSLLPLLVVCTQPTDLQPQIRLGVEPGPGDAAVRATVSKVTGSPLAARRRSAWMARSRVAWLRRRAAWTRKRLLSARTCGLLAEAGLRILAGLQLGDDPVQGAEHLLVHLDQAELPVGGGALEQPAGLLTLGAVLVEELRGGDEHRADQALACRQRCWIGRPQ